MISNKLKHHMVNAGISEYVEMIDEILSRVYKDVTLDYDGFYYVIITLRFGELSVEHKVPTVDLKSGAYDICVAIDDMLRCSMMVYLKRCVEDKPKSPKGENNV